jgi:hypothetical protein
MLVAHLEPEASGPVCPARIEGALIRAMCPNENRRLAIDDTFLEIGQKQDFAVLLVQELITEIALPIRSGWSGERKRSDANKNENRARDDRATKRSRRTAEGLTGHLRTSLICGGAMADRAAARPDTLCISLRFAGTEH